MPVSRILLARHGERVDLVDNQWTLTAERPHDAPLTAVGLQQAHKLGERLKHEGVSRIYASPFLRTVQTAAQVAGVLQMPICIENGLCEPLLNRLFPETFAGFNHPETLAKDMPCIDTSYQVVRKPQHPESYRQAQQRCAEVVHALAEQHPGESILLVTHGLCLEYMAVQQLMAPLTGSVIPRNAYVKAAAVGHTGTMAASLMPPSSSFNPPQQSGYNFLAV